VRDSSARGQLPSTPLQRAPGLEHVAGELQTERRGSAIGERGSVRVFLRRRRRHVHLHLPGAPRHGARDPPDDVPPKRAAAAAIAHQSQRGRRHQSHAERLKGRAVLGVEAEAAAHRCRSPRQGLVVGEIPVDEVTGEEASARSHCGAHRG
jgi:hypothetical protein